MSDASEVKRWGLWRRFKEDSLMVVHGEYDMSQLGPCDTAVKVMAVEDHDRIMSERDELWKRATKFVMPGEMDTGESIEHYIKTLEQNIATQARAIKKLKRYTQHRVECIYRTGVFQYSNDCDCGLKAIEQGEGT